MISFFLGVLYAGGALALFAGLLALVVARGTRAIEETHLRVECGLCDHGLVWNPTVTGNVEPCWRCFPRDFA